MAEEVAVGEAVAVGGEWFPDWEARYERLINDGMPARLELVLGEEWDGAPGLWMIEAHPIEDPALWAPRIAGFVYHVSIAEEPMITPEELAQIRTDFDGKTMTIRFFERHGGYLVLAGDFWSHAALNSAHARGKYSDRILHMSF
jgi:hypothetical protein